MSKSMRDHEYGKFTDDSEVRVVSSIADGTHNDAFSRLRTSSAKVIFDAQHHFGEQHYLFVPVLTGAATVVNDYNNSSIIHTVTSAIGDKVVNRSRRHYYQAGHSQMVAATFKFGAQITGIRKLVGYIDDDDGIALEQTAAGDMRLFIRTSTSGSPVVSQSVNQADWNIDPMDGTGPSGITVDWTKTHILIMDMQWLGVGRVRIALDIDGVICPVHEFLNANTQTTVYMQTANLPVCYETENVSSVVGDTFQQICSAVFSEGSDDLLAIRRSASNAVAPITVSTSLTPILSIRPAALFKGRANKGTLIPTRIEVFVQSGNNPIHFEIYEDVTITGQTWVPHQSIDSMCEYAVNGTYISGGRWRGAGYVASNGKGGSGGNVAGTDSNYQMQIDPAGAADTLTVLAQTFSGTAPVVASIEWSERY